MVSHKAVNVDKRARVVKCCRNTLQSRVEALMRVSSMRIAFRGSMFSSSLANNGNRTLLKQASHSMAESFCSSWTSKARCRYCKACMRTSPFLSQLSRAIPCSMGHQQFDHKFDTTEHSISEFCWRCSSAQHVNIEAALLCNVSNKSKSFMSFKYH